jgi:hypothetical protein
MYWCRTEMGHRRRTGEVGARPQALSPPVVPHEVRELLPNPPRRHALEAVHQDEDTVPTGAYVTVSSHGNEYNSEMQLRYNYALGHREALNAFGDSVRPPFAVAAVSETGTLRGAA